MANALEDFHEELFQEILSQADAGSAFIEDAFFEIFSTHLVDAGELETADRAQYIGNRGVRVDGYGGDPRGSDGVLNVIVADFKQSDAPETLTATDLKAISNRASNFVEKALDRGFRESLEESTPAYGLADLIAARWSKTNKVRIVLMSNRVLSSRVDGVPGSEIQGVPVTHNVWDLGRLNKYILSGREREDIEIDLVKDFGGPIPALRATLADADYGAYLLVVPGGQIADIYDRWTTRLLEQNVRVFLQASGGVNKGIRVTLENDPEMFFAYNNGITATADAVDTEFIDDQLCVTRLSNLQIVNGGQTTASIHAAGVRKIDLSRVFVQMKLSIIDQERTNEVVPKISQFANTQNRVSQADFFSNHPFHVRIEQFSRRVYAPSPDGTFNHSKWFYERARGQYRDARAGLTATNRKKFDSEYPRTQLFSKTDLAKFLTVWDGGPDTVSKGAQKNFAAFAEKVAKQWDKNPDVFSETYYKDAVAKAIVFRDLEKQVIQQPWYGGGYRANVVAYAIAKLAHDVGGTGKSIDFDSVWKAQEPSAALRASLLVASEAVHGVLTNPATGHMNVTEWAKQQACWHQVQILKVDWPESTKTLTVSAETARAAAGDGVKDQRLLNGIEAQTAVVKAGAEFWREARLWGLARKLLSPNESDVLNVCAQMPRSIPSEKQSAMAMRVHSRLEKEGLQLDVGQ